MRKRIPHKRTAGGVKRLRAAGKRTMGGLFLSGTVRNFHPENMEDTITLFGTNDENMRALMESTHTRITIRDTALEIEGEEENTRAAQAVIQRMAAQLRRREGVDAQSIRYASQLAMAGEIERMDEMMNDVVATTHRGRQIRAKTLGQQQYIEAIRKNTLTFGVGPAGTGKTYLAMAMAVAALKNREVERIVLTRPAVEAGEKLGFLPGDLSQKVDPYLRPLFDALYDMMGPDSYQRLSERGAVEVAPLAYMRGRTLSDSFIILDEAQNTTSEQMKMFLTRMGFRSRVVVTGDLTQVDLPRGKISGLAEAIYVLDQLRDIAIVRLTARDVVRHELVQTIVHAYEERAHHTREEYHGWEENRGEERQ